MARQLVIVGAPGPSEVTVLSTVVPALRAALDGVAPLSVLPSGSGVVVAGARAALRPADPVEDGADLVVVTSGSTGAVRGVLLSGAALRASAAATARRLGGEGTWLLALPPSAIAGLQVLARNLLAGRRPVVLEQGESLTAAAGRMPADRRYTSLVPTQLRRYLDREPDALRGFDAVLVGGAAADPDLLARTRAEGVRVVTSYGMTETAGGCVYDGRPLDGVEVRIGTGIEIRGPVLALGYRGNPAAAAEAFVDGWFRTRDAGALSAEGVLTVHGRLDDVVVTGGVNVAPQAVEAALRAHPDVADAVAFGRPDDEWGSRVVAAVVPVVGARPELATLRPWVAARLGAAAAPRELHLVEGIPLLHTGKPDRRAVARTVGA